MTTQERFLGRCACGGVYDRPIPEKQADCDAWLARHRKFGHRPTFKTYTQKVGTDNPEMEPAS